MFGYKSIFIIMLFGFLVFSCKQNKTSENLRSTDQSTDVKQNILQDENGPIIRKNIQNDSLFSIYSNLLIKIKGYSDSINTILDKIKLVDSQLKNLQKERENVLSTKKLSEKAILNSLVKMDSLMLALERKHKLLSEEIPIYENKIDIDKKRIDDLRKESDTYENKITILIREKAAPQEIQKIKMEIDSINKQIAKLQTDLSSSKLAVINSKQQMESIDDSLQSFADTIRGKYFDKQNLDSFYDQELENIEEKTEPLVKKKDSLNIILIKLNKEKNNFISQMNKIKDQLSPRLAGESILAGKVKQTEKHIQNNKNNKEQLWPKFIFIGLMVLILILILFYMLGKKASENN